VRCSSSPSLSFFVPHRLILLLYDYPQRWLLCDGCLDELLLVGGDGISVYGKEDVKMSAYRATVLLEVVCAEKASASGH
jgi:hypothetical protein